MPRQHDPDDARALDAAAQKIMDCYYASPQVPVGAGDSEAGAGTGGGDALTVRECDWTEDFGAENDYHWRLCPVCETGFHGHKDRFVCKTCAGFKQPEESEEPLPAEPAPQSAREWVKERLYTADGRNLVLDADDSYELADRCDAAERELAAAQAEAREYKEALGWLEDEAPSISHDAWTCSVDMAGNRWTLQFRNDGKRERIRGQTLIQTINNARAALKQNTDQ